MAKRGHIPKRRCVGCYQTFEKRTLVRIALAGGVPVIDESGRAPGRGAYVCANPACLKVALKKRSIQRSLRANIEGRDIEALTEPLQAAWQRRAVVG